MKLRKLVSVALMAGALFAIAPNDAEAVTVVHTGNSGSTVVDEASIIWSGNKEFNALIYELNPKSEIVKRGIYTFRYLSEYKNWYYHPLEIENEFVRVDVDNLEKIPPIAEEMKKKKYQEQNNMKH